MEQREIFVTLLSAQDLKKVSAFGKMAVYAVAWVNPSEKVSSPVDKIGNLNPTWNATLKLTADERRVEDGNAVLVVDLYDHGTFGNTHVGSCTIPLSGLKPPAKLSDEKADDKTPSTEGSSSSSASFMAVPVLRKSGTAKGTLNLSVKLGELVRHRAPAAPSYMAAGKVMPGAEDKGLPAYAYPAQGYPPAYGQPGYAAPGGAQPYPMYQQAPYEQAQYQQQQPPYQQGQYQQQPPYQPAPYQQGPYQQGPYQQPPPYFPPGGYAPPPPPPQQQRRAGLGGMGGGLGLGLAGGALGGLLLGSALDSGDGGGDGGGGGCGGGGGGCGGGCGG